jgi:hypothetical protein
MVRLVSVVASTARVKLVLLKPTNQARAAWCSVLENCLTPPTLSERQFLRQ